MKQLLISQTDAFFVTGLYPIEFLLFYDAPIETNRLRNSLKRLYRSWWPLFGSYADGLIRSERFEDEALLDEEIRAEDFLIPASGAEFFKECREFSRPLLDRLFHLSIIRFRNGTMLIPKLNHLAGDGYSYFTFLAFFAAMTRGSQIPLRSAFLGMMVTPNHRRTVLKRFRMGVTPPSPAPESGNTRIEYEEIPVAEVQSVAGDLSDRMELRISANDVLSAMTLRKIAERQDDEGIATINLSIPIDVRRMVTEYGRRFIGNALQIHTLSFEREELLSAPIEQVIVKIRDSMPAITRESYRNYLTCQEERIERLDPDAFRPFNPDTGCLVTNLTRMPVERLDFGSGPPVLVYPLTTGRRAAALMRLENRFVIRTVC
jgi:hypothetical protein